MKLIIIILLCISPLAHTGEHLTKKQFFELIDEKSPILNQVRPGMGAWEFWTTVFRVYEQGNPVSCYITTENTIYHLTEIAFKRYQYVITTQTKGPESAPNCIANAPKRFVLVQTLSASDIFKASFDNFDQFILNEHSLVIQKTFPLQKIVVNLKAPLFYGPLSHHVILGNWFETSMQKKPLTDIDIKDLDLSHIELCTAKINATPECEAPQNLEYLKDDF